MPHAPWSARPRLGALPSAARVERRPAARLLAGVLGLLAAACADEVVSPVDPGRVSLDHKPGHALPGSFQIAFVSTRDGNDEIYVMKRNGTDQTSLTQNAGGDGGAVWSPDGNQIAFSSRRDGNFEIYVMHADGSGQTNLTQNAAFEFQPAWSPDGSQIAFETVRDGNSEVYVVNADGTGQTNLTQHGALDGAPIWRP
jgi:Tol biopolymer transport system component